MRQERKLKCRQMEKEGVNCLCSGGMIVSAENSREWTKENLQELLHKHNKVLGYKITVQKSIASIYQ